MPRNMLLLITGIFPSGLLLPEFVAAQTKKPPSEHPAATGFRAEEITPGSITKVGKLSIVKTVLLNVAGGNCEYRYPPEKYLPDANC